MEVRAEPSDRERSLVEAGRRRTFAIISHPDAGKSTLTEKILLYSGAVVQAGAVKARGTRRGVTSDWMAIERERGISVTSSVLQTHYRGVVLNLLDTPGHRDFSEDTFRVLTAVDAALMVLDAAKGIESQTLRLFEVCRDHGVPILTFLNKMDRPGRAALELVDEVTDRLGLAPWPATWPVGETGSLTGLLDRRAGGLVELRRTDHGSSLGEERLSDLPEVPDDELAQAFEECELLEATHGTLSEKALLAGEQTPVFSGSALTNLGVRQLLDAIVDLAPSPAPREDRTGAPRPLESPFSGFVFKIQANMNPDHRDHVAFVRCCSGRFRRGMTVTVAETGRPFATKYAASLFGAERETLDEGWPGDVVGLVNASELSIGDTLYEAEPVHFPPIPAFVPELFARARAVDSGRYKQFRRGLEQLDREGVVQVLDGTDDDPRPVVAAVGELQFEIFAHRMHHELGAEVELHRLPWRVARRTDERTAEALGPVPGCTVLVRRRDQARLALFESLAWLEHCQAAHPDWTLERPSGSAEVA
jgi:peptide chain release factor 3